MAIITLTINPALDKSTYVDELIHTQKIYSDAPLFSAGGGGINVSRVLKRLGVDALAIMQASGPNGAHLKEMLNDEGIGFSAFETKGWTRENFVVNERSTQLQYRFDMPGPKMTTEELDRAFGMIQAKVSPNDYLVLSGSLPPSVPSVFYGEVCAWAKANQVKVVLDTKGEALKHALEEGVYLVKPNLGELAQLYQKNWISNEETIKLAKDILKKNQAEKVVVSLGENGAFLISRDATYSVLSPQVEVKSAVGAGDSMVAGVVYALMQNKSDEASLKYGVACGTATVLSEGTNLCSVEDIERIHKMLS